MVLRVVFMDVHGCMDGGQASEQADELAGNLVQDFV